MKKSFKEIEKILHDSNEPWLADELHKVPEDRLTAINDMITSWRNWGDAEGIISFKVRFDVTAIITGKVIDLYSEKFFIENLKNKKINK